MLGGIKDILIISTPEDTHRFQALLSDGSQLGINISYKVQPSPDGLAQAFIIGEEFIGSDSVALILGDNLFFGHGFSDMLCRSKNIVLRDENAVIFGYNVKNPKRYGVVEFNNQNEVVSLEEKPANPASNYAVVGLYFYPNEVVEIAKNIKPSKRGELEITSINEVFMKKKKLSVEVMGRGYAWLDTGTQDSMINASNFIKTIEDRQGLKVGCIEEIAYLNNLIDKNQIIKISEKYNNEYGNYLRAIIKR
jgi:glucose-1-phosphate thymidylyltransferase